MNKLTALEIELARELLKNNPGHAYITDDGTKLLALVEKTGEIVCIEAPEGKSFNNLTVEQANAVLVDFFVKALN